MLGSADALVSAELSGVVEGSTSEEIDSGLIEAAKEEEEVAERGSFDDCINLLTFADAEGSEEADALANAFATPFSVLGKGTFKVSGFGVGVHEARGVLAGELVGSFAFTGFLEGVATVVTPPFPCAGAAVAVADGADVDSALAAFGRGVARFVELAVDTGTGVAFFVELAVDTTFWV